MLQLVIPESEWFNEESFEFGYIKETKLQLEHSLISISKWESKWCKPFLEEGNKTIEETIDYIRCMTINSNVDPKVYKFIKSKDIDRVQEYIKAPMSATTFTDRDIRRGGIRTHRKTTSELIYFWMTAYNIPHQYEKWHLNRLLNLIKICSIENGPKKPMSKAEIMRQNSILNEQRKARLGTNG